MTTFHITLSPQRRNGRLRLEKRGATLLFNEELVDPSAYDESAPVSQWIVGRPEAVEGGWSVEIILPHGSPAPHSTRFPVPISVTADGAIALPPYEGPDEDADDLRAEVSARISSRRPATVTTDGTLKIPERLTLADMPEGVYFSETASPFDRHPEFGAVVAHVIATASLLDLEMQRPAVSLHGRDALLAVRTAFKALRNDKDKKRNYTLKIAEQTGRQEVSKTIRWAYDYCEPVFDLRNAFAHNIWGECPALPNALLLAEPTARLLGQAAMAQLMGHASSEGDAQALLHIARGEGGSKLSEEDAKTIFGMVMSRQHAPGRIEAFDMTFGNPLDMNAPAAEIWTRDDFTNAALAANMARIHVVGRLQQISQWLHGLRARDDLEPLPGDPQGTRRR